MNNKKIHEPYNLPTLDDFFERTHGSYMGRVEKININRIENFKNHPFKVKDDEQMENLVESIKENGVLNPIIVRPTKDNKFEIVSGHRRKRAVELADIGEIPCIVRELTDDEATILMVDSNLQREEILPSEKAFAYKMKMEAMVRQGKRTDLTSTPLVEKLRTNEQLAEEEKLRNNEQLAEEVGESREQIRRYIRLTNLIPEILQMVDEKKIAFRPAVEISYLTKDEQEILLDIMQYNESTPSLAQAILMKKQSQDKILTEEKIEEVMSEEKPNQIEKIKINRSKIENVIPKNIVTQNEIEDFIVMCIQEHNKKQRQKENLSR